MWKTTTWAGVVLIFAAIVAPLRGQPDRAKERAAVERAIRDSIGWALTKDRPLLERVIAHDAGLFIFHPDSKSTVVGWDAFARNFAFWMDPRFKATSFDVRDLRITFSPAGDIAWYSAMLDDLAEWDGKPGGWRDTRWTGVLERRDGTWVIVQMHFSFASDRPVAAARGPRFEDRTGPYLGESPPGLTPQVFAPGLIGTGGFERDLAITPDGREIYFGVAGPAYQYTTIAVTRLIDGRWTEPEVVPGLDDPRYLHLEPALSADGNTLYYLSTRPDTAAGVSPGNQDIWYLTRTPEGWSAPRNLGAPINSAAPEYFPSVTRDGTVYFTREEPGSRAGSIWRARRSGSGYLPPEKLPPQVNSGRSQFNAFVAPDESYAIVPIDGRSDSIGGSDYYVVFRDSNDRWSEPINIGPAVNTTGSQEFSPYVSPDGKYFFFMSSRLARPERLTFRGLRDLQESPGNGNADIYWVDATLVTSLRARAVFGEKRPRATS